MNSKRKRIYTLILVGSILSFFLFKLVYSIVEKFNNEAREMVRSIDDEYASLFNEVALDRIIDPFTMTYKGRSVSLAATYDSIYAIMVFTISDSADRFSFDKNFIISDDESSTSNGIIYRIKNDNLFEMHYISDSFPNLQSLFVTFKGDSLEAIYKNDSTICYHGIFNNFSISENTESDKEFYCNVKNGINPFDKNYLPVDIVFMKRKHRLYFVVLSQNIRDAAFDKNVVYDLIR